MARRIGFDVSLDLHEVPDAQRAPSPDGARIAGWWIASERGGHEEDKTVYGIAVWDALRAVRKDIVVFANADAVRVNPRFTDVVIPVEWLMDKRSPAKTRETLRRAADAFAQEKCVVIFPSGKLARMVDGALWEQPWFTTVVGLARKQKAPICPLNVRARNSRLFYFFSKVNGELRDITLFHELLNKRRSRFDLTFGPLIHPDALAGPGQDVTDALKEFVAYELTGKPELTFPALPVG